MNIGRNEQCPCGTSLKYKKCCLPRQEAAEAEAKRIADIDFEEWFQKDQLIGAENLKNAQDSGQSFNSLQSKEGKPSEQKE